MKKRSPLLNEERLKIARCHEDYEISISALSERFKVTYTQAYQYVKKYEAEGVYGLEGRRGRRSIKASTGEVFSSSLMS